ncbi:hypothetical protein VP01_2938g3 [Puccinia sorghi]|uniref:Uncharacterized protein n=1 Tax=Puccinia sorghi TaxID=27349 RepID=A0A0L6V140_9BASI|nr:hypothetical protein VP01_2938g3 [Puccinia sorghi]
MHIAYNLPPILFSFLLFIIFYAPHILIHFASSISFYFNLFFILIIPPCYKHYPTPSTNHHDDTDKTMKDQFNTYKDKYEKFHTKSISISFGLTNEN